MVLPRRKPEHINDHADPLRSNFCSLINCIECLQGIEELKHLLFCATLELDRERAIAEMQRQIQKAKLLRLQELLTVTRRERDEAHEHLQKLNHRLADILTNTQHHVMSSDRSQWPDSRLTAAEPDGLNPLNPSTTTTTTGTAAVMHSNSSPLVGLTDQFSRPSFRLIAF